MLNKQLMPIKSLSYKNKLLVASLIAVIMLTGCTSNTQKKQTPNNLVSFKDKRIILKQGTVIQYNYYQSNDLWDRMRSGFQMQNEYLSNSNLRIERQQQLLTSNNKATEQLLAKGSPYLHYIVEQLEARNMPLELALLPAVESAYDPTAFSNMKAAGLWQFMPRTGTQFNLPQTRWYDGRLDVVASTNAALNYLQYLHNMFNDWPLALAAYNAGEGTVKRAIEQNQKINLPTDYWNLALPSETTNYVPKLLALSKIVLSPSNYQVNLRSIPNQPYFTKVSINQQVKLNTVASLLNVHTEELAKLNAGLKSQAVISNESPQHLLVPAHKAPILNDMVAAGNLPNENISLWNDYSVKRGDTLGTIASQHNISVIELKKINKLANNHILKVGYNIKVPPSTNTSNPDKTMRTIVLKDKKKYTIQAGDNLWAISKKNNIKLEKLLQLNKINMNTALKPGQQLYISDRN